MKPIDKTNLGLSYVDLLKEFPNACAIFLPCDNDTKNTAVFQTADSSTPMTSADELFLVFNEPWDRTKEYIVDNLKVVQNSVFGNYFLLLQEFTFVVRSIRDNIVSYLSIPHTKDAKSTGLPLCSLVKAFPSACGLFYIDQGKIVTVGFETLSKEETGNSKIARDYVVIGSKGLDFSKQYFVDYRMSSFS